MFTKKRKQVLTTVLAASLIFQGTGIAEPAQAAQENSSKALSESDLALALEEPSGYEKAAIIDNNSVAVHDPSVVKNETKKDGEGNYYVFGSHMAVAKSDDLSTWTQVSVRENDSDSPLFGVRKEGKTTVASFQDAFRTNAYTGKVKVTYAGQTTETEVDFGSFDAAAWNTARDYYSVSGNMWAPDVIYNRTTQEYDMYLSLNGSRWNSVIILLTSKDIEGPYVYQGPVVYSGFSNSVKALSYKNTDLELVYGSLDRLPEKYDKADNGTWGNYYPHAIDPAVFYDEEGTLRMIYGSWSGGIYEIVLDEKTGLRDYTVTYADDGTEKDIKSDPYFGIHIAGGYYVSGEGSYMKYIDGKYYLFLSYGDYNPYGNYQMRIFSSKNPEGPFTDTNGVSAIYDEFQVNFNADYGDCYDGSDHGKRGTTRGSRLMDNYKWDTMERGEVSQGHNSAITADGRNFVIYHTKYDDGSFWHNLRVHELFSIDGGLTAAPYPYDSSVKEKEAYEESDVTGNFQIIFQKYDTNKHWTGGASTAYGGTGYLKSYRNTDCETPELLSFTADGTLLLEEKEVGTWVLGEDKKSLTLTISDTYGDSHLTGEYHAILTEQNADGEIKTCFTGIRLESGIGIWGTANGDSDKRAIARTKEKLEMAIPSEAEEDLTFPVKGLSGTTIKWTSSKPSALRANGTIGKVTKDTVVALTARISRGNFYFEKTYDVTVIAPDSAVKTIAPGTSKSGANKYLKKQTTNGDISGSIFKKLMLKAKKSTNTSISLSWKKVVGAEEYIIYGNTSGKNAFKKIATVTGTSYTQKELKKGTYYKYLVIAYNEDDRIISGSKTIHAATTWGKYTNPKAVTTQAKKNKVSIQKKKTFPLKAKATPVSKKLTLKKYSGIRYESATPSIASVSKKGVITGKSKGTAVIYAYAQNGVMKKITVKVK